MGGKTQQRVAGNVKPTSSGRIRDLLITKQQGVSNIITFSALSTPENKATLNNNIHEKKLTTTPPRSIFVDNKEKSSTSETATTTTSDLVSKDQTTLIVKRVGFRDYYTRVRPSEDSPTKPVQRKVFPFPTEDTVKAPNVMTLNPESIDEYKKEKLSEETTTDLEEESNLLEKEVLEEHDFDNILDKVSQHRSNNSHIEAKTLDEVEDERIEQDDKLIDLLIILVVNFKEDLSIEDWDFINCSITSWISLILNSQQLATSPIRTGFCVKVFNFIHRLVSLVETLKDTENIKQDHPLLQCLIDDWENFHSSKTYIDLITLYFKLVSKGDQLTKEELQIIKSFTSIMINVDPKLVVTNTSVLANLKVNVEVDAYYELPKEIRYCDIKENGFRGFSGISNLLRSNSRIITVAAHTMLRKIMNPVSDIVNISSTMLDQVDTEKLLIAPPEPLMALLMSRDSMMSALLSDYRVGDISVTIDPNTDSYTCTLVYLFIWDLVVQFIVGIDKESGHRIIHCLRKLGLIDRLLDTIFMLVPPLGERNSLNFKLETDEYGDHESNQSWTLSEFLKSPLQANVRKPVNEIELTALHVYFSVALHMPVTVRKWYNNNSNKKLCNLVNEYTVKHISKVICSLEMESVQEKCTERANEDKMNNLVIKARPNSREVYAVYNRDEFKLELTIKLPINYPLGSVIIDGGKRVGVTDLKWRSWLLHLTKFLSHQNGPILDGIDLWRNNIDKRFEGIEKCVICYAILHSNYQLPRRKCQTCSKMFHNLCLYKWFETSGNTTCPHCRNVW